MPRYGSADPPDATGFNVVRSGTVVDRRMGTNGPEVQVAYYDRGETSDWLPVGHHGSAGATMFYCPRLNDNVTVLHYPTAIEQGIVVCTNPTSNGGSIQPDSLNSIAMMGDNGEQFSYNPDTKTLAIHGVGSINITVAGDTYLQTNGNLTAKVGGGADLEAGGTVTLKGSQVIINCDCHIKGKLTVDGVTLLDAGGTATPNLINADGSGNGS
jgi:phage baseplate assembly protein V